MSKLTITLLSLLIVCLCTSTFGQASSGNKTNPDDLWSQFKLIVDRNIFSRNRQPYRPPVKRSIEPEKPRFVASPESLVVLKGIVRENGQFVAFFEDNGATVRAKIGEKVARGSVESLTLDHVIFVHEDKTRTITIGQNLEGNYSSGSNGFNDSFTWSQSESTSSSTTSTPTSSSTSTTSETESTEASDILKQLMERRRQQLGD